MTKMIKMPLALAMMLVVGLANALPMAFMQGSHYQMTKTLLPMAEGTQSEVVELFMYTCPHCYHLEPEVEDWKKSLTDTVSFKQVPAVFNENQEPLARAHYAAEAMNLLEKLHPLFFEAIHEDGINLNSNSAILDYVAEQGVDRASFEKMMTSFAVKTKVKKASSLTKQSGVGGVPAFVVNGKYHTSGPMAGSVEAIFEIVDFLVEQDN